MVVVGGKERKGAGRRRRSRAGLTTPNDPCGAPGARGAEKWGGRVGKAFPLVRGVGKGAGGVKGVGCGTPGKGEWGWRPQNTRRASFAAYEYAQYDDPATTTTPNSSDSSFLLDDDPFGGQGQRAGKSEEKPAFRARWSLPSLDTLAKMIVVPPKAFNLFILVTIAHRRQVRRDHVGAGLPAEPWDIEHTVPSTFLDLSDEDDEEPATEGQPPDDDALAYIAFATLAGLTDTDDKQCSPAASASSWAARPTRQTSAPDLSYSSSTDAEPELELSIGSTLAKKRATPSAAAASASPPSWATCCGLRPRRPRVRLGPVREAEGLGLDIDLTAGGFLNLEMDFGGRDAEDEEVRVRGEETEEDADADALTPAELDAALSRLSTVNDVGHEPLEGVVVFPSAEMEGPRYAMPIMRSPERERVSDSPPLSTPYDSASASTSSPESNSSAPGGFDFGWLPGERGSASASGSEFEYDL
ncbi:hypothetical protein B0H11DRAFT_2252222 [Mycena galericulata]|nr:hypothetical protein B0H11DRAFT_2252222 [Mycena galericulata]